MTKCASSNGFCIASCTSFAASFAQADVTGTLAATSEYMFRGIERSEGAAVQGSLNYAHETGFYASVWGLNVDKTLGSTEVDVYGGWTGDVGAILYYFPENNEDAATVVDNADFLELYAGVALAG